MTSGKPTIAVIGSLNYDLVSVVNQLPDQGETIASRSFSTNGGGKGANQAVAAARISNNCEEVNVKMIGAVGDDEFGGKLKSGLQAYGIDVEDVAVVQGTNSGVAVIIVEAESGNNRIMISAGANGALTPASLPTKLFEAETAPDLIIAQMEIPINTVSSIIQRSKESHEIPLLFNPAPAVPIPPIYYSMIDILIVNETEASHLSGIQFGDPGEAETIKAKGKEALDWFVDKGPRDVIVTLGALGAVYYAHQTQKKGYVPAEKVERVVDSTGAGDTFVGAIAVSFVTAKAKGSTFELEEAVKYATKAAAWSVQRKGTWDAVPLGKDLN